MSALDKIVAAHSVRLSGMPADWPEPPDELVHAALSGLGEASRVFAACDLTSVDPAVRQAIVLVLSARDCIEAAVPGLGVMPESRSWVEATALDTRALALAKDDSDSSKPYGDEDYADPGHQSDGKKRYPTTEGGKLSEKRIRAAWSYINQGDDAAKYSSSQVASIKAKIKAAASKAGVSISSDDDSKKVAATYVMLAAPAQEMASHTHDPFHGTHSHAHTHLGDAAHGPDIGHHSSPFDHGAMPR